jgi:bacterioferritin
VARAFLSTESRRSSGFSRESRHAAAKAAVGGKQQIAIRAADRYIFGHKALVFVAERGTQAAPGKRRRLVKGNTKLIATLNDLLADELTAINQYMVHSEMCANWGYERLHKKIERRAIEEMKHAEKLIARIIFLEGLPKVDKLNKLHIGSTVPAQLADDLKAEMGAIAAYSKAVRLACDAGDTVTRTMLEQIAGDEDRHLDWLEEQIDQIKQMGLEVYLSTQTGE